MYIPHGGKRIGAGRPKGSRNKRSDILIEKMEKKFPKWCPVEQLAEIAQDENHPIEVRAKCAERVAAYMYSKPKEEKPDPNAGGKDWATLITEARARARILQSHFTGTSQTNLKEINQRKIES